VVRGSSETELAHGVGIAIVDSKVDYSLLYCMPLINHCYPVLILYSYCTHTVWFGVGIAIVDSKDLGRDDFISKFFSVGRPVLVKNALKVSNTLSIHYTYWYTLYSLYYYTLYSLYSLNALKASNTLYILPIHYIHYTIFTTLNALKVSNFKPGFFFFTIHTYTLSPDVELVFQDMKAHKWDKEHLIKTAGEDVAEIGPIPYSKRYAEHEDDVTSLSDTKGETSKVVRTPHPSPPHPSSTLSLTSNNQTNTKTHQQKHTLVLAVSFTVAVYCRGVSR
jgi:hypothetical protein